MKHATKGIDDSMIPIARPQVGDPEIENVVHVLRSGMLAGGRFGRAVLDPCNLCGGRFA
jgi:dTDP-4-amino-4,6-dideoxygalactose transaminase